MSPPIYISPYSFTLIAEMEDLAQTATNCMKGKKTLLGIAFSGALRPMKAFNSKLDQIITHEFSGKDQDAIVTRATARGIDRTDEIYLPLLISHIDPRLTVHIRQLSDMYGHMGREVDKTGSDFAGLLAAPAFLETLDA